jgi:HSP20 family protein
MFIVQSRNAASPFAHLLGQTVQELFSGSSVAQSASLLAAQDATRTPALDLTESASAYTASLELPGVRKEDVQVSVDGKRVTVKAQAAASEPSAATPADAADVESQPFINHREREAARYARSFKLPQEVVQAETVAKLENGVLTLTLPKRAPHVAAQVTVN